MCSFVCLCFVCLSVCCWWCSCWCFLLLSLVSSGSLLRFYCLNIYVCFVLFLLMSLDRRHPPLFLMLSSSSRSIFVYVAIVVTTVMVTISIIITVTTVALPPLTLSAFSVFRRHHQHQSHRKAKKEGRQQSIDRGGEGREALVQIGQE